MGPSMFGVYLLHDATPLGKFIYEKQEVLIWRNLQWHPVMNIFASAATTFVLCCVVDVARRISLEGLRRLLCSKGEL